MTSNDILTRPPFQLGYVFPRASTGEAFMLSMGAGRFTRFDDAPVHSQTLNGVPMECRQNLAFGFLGDLNIELVEPIDGQNIYTQFLDGQPEGGLHHIAWKVEDIDDAMAAMRNAGLNEVQTGRFGAGTRFAYYDARTPLGHYLELLYFDADTQALFDTLKTGG